MAARGRDESRESRDESERRKFHRRGAIGPRLLELQADVAVVQNLQPVVGEGRAQDVRRFATLGPAHPPPAPRALRARPSAAQGQSAGLVVGGDTASAMQVEAVGAS